MAFGSVGQVALDLTLNTSKFNSQLGKTTQMLKGLGTIIGGAFAVGAVIKFSKQCLDLGSDLAEVQNVVDVTFGDMSNQVDAFARNAIESYGLSEKVAKQYMGTFGAMSKSFGFTVAQSYEMSKALTGLSGDVASFYNLSTDEAYTKLKAVYTGETEALKELGVVMTQNALDAYAMAKGYGKTTNAMSEQEKVSLRLAFVTDKLSAASGDFTRTAGGWANQTRVLALRFDALKASIGQGLINALTPVVQWLNVLLAKLQQFADAFANIMARIFGDAGGGGSSPLAAASADAGGIASGLGDAVGAAKALKRAAAGFDEMNIMTIQASGGGGAGGSVGAGGIGGGEIPAGGSGNSLLPTLDTAPFEEKLSEIAAIAGVSLLALGVVLAFTGANIPLGIGLMVAGAAGLATAVALDWALVQDSVASTLDVIGAAVSGALLTIGAIIAISGANLPLGIGLMAVGAAGLATVAALNWTSVNNNCKRAITGLLGIVGGALLALGAILAFSGVKIPLGIALMAAGAVSLAAAAGMNWGAMAGSIAGTVTTISAIVGGALLGLGAVLAFSGANIPLGISLMASGAVSLASALAVNWGGLPKETQKTISIVAGIAGAALLALGVILVCTGAGIPLGLGLIAAGGMSLAAAIAPNWGAITKTVKDVCDKIGKFFKDMLEGIKKCFKSVINGIIGGFEGFVNGIIGGINWLIKCINKLSFKVPDWVPGIGGKEFGFKLKEVSKISLPRLATGGYVRANTPQLAIIGDNKKEGEIVAPESKIAEAVAAGVAAAMRQVMQMLGQNAAPAQGGTRVVLTVDGRELGYATIDSINAITRQTGALQLNLI